MDKASTTGHRAKKGETKDLLKYGGMDWEHNPAAYKAVLNFKAQPGIPNITTEEGDVLRWICSRCYIPVYAVTSLQMSWRRLEHIANKHAGISAKEFPGSRSTIHLPVLVDDIPENLEWQCAQCRKGFRKNDGTPKGISTAAKRHLAECKGAARTPWLNHLRLLDEKQDAGPPLSQKHLKPKP